MALLEARGLVKQYGRRTVVNGVDIEVNAGEIVGLLGPNGAGKTTSFRMMVGMITPKAGVVRFNNIDVTQMPMYKRAQLGLGYLAQDNSVFRKLTAEQNLYAILELMTTRRGMPYHSTSRQRKERVNDLLEQFGLTRLRRSIAGTMSGGERRRLEIARCLVSEPMLIMLDEPFTGIDPKTVGDIQEIVRALRDQGIGVLITDHHVAETLRITDRSYLIADGRMLSHGTPLEIVNDPKARAVYLGEHFNTAGITDNPRDSKPRPAPTLCDTTPVQRANDIRSLLDNEETFDLVNQLASDQWRQAADLLRGRFRQAVPLLLQALQRKDPVVRERAALVLRELTGLHLQFDPHGDERTRLLQISGIRDLLGERLAS